MIAPQFVHVKTISMMDNSREQCCTAIAIWTPAVRLIVEGFVGSLEPMHLNLRRHRALPKTGSLALEVIVTPSPFQRRLTQRRDIRSEMEKMEFIKDEFVHGFTHFWGSTILDSYGYRPSFL